MLAQGVNGRVRYREGGVVIERVGATAFRFHSKRAPIYLPFNQMGSVTFKEPRMIFSGFIAFGTDPNLPGFDKHRDPLTVIFNWNHWADFSALNKIVQAEVEALAFRPVRGKPMGVADELSKLTRLRQQGVITDQEFAIQKAKLLGS